MQIQWTHFICGIIHHNSQHKVKENNPVYMNFELDC